MGISALEDFVRIAKDITVPRRLLTLAAILTAVGIAAGCPGKIYPPVKSPPENPCRVYCGEQMFEYPFSPIISEAENSPNFHKPKIYKHSF